AHQMVLHLVNVSFLPAHALAEAAAVLVGQAVGANKDVLVGRVAKRALALGGGYASVCLVGYAVLGGAIATAMASGDAALAARAQMLVHVSLAFLIADSANVIARGVLRGASDVRYAAVVGIATSWLTTPPLAWALGIGCGLGAVGGWIGLAVEIIVGASLFWLRVIRGGWRPAAAAARRSMAGVAVWWCDPSPSVIEGSGCYGCPMRAVGILAAAALSLVALPARADTAKAWSAAKAGLPADAKVVLALDFAALQKTQVFAELWPKLLERFDAAKVLDEMKAECKLDPMAMV